MMLARLMVVRILMVLDNLFRIKIKTNFHHLIQPAKEVMQKLFRCLLDDALARLSGGKNTDGFREFISSQK